MARWTRWGLYAQLIVSGVAIVSGALELQFLANVRAGVYASREEFDALAIANDERQAAVGLAQVAVFIAAGILILMWIHRANHNARAMGARDLRFTPGWSVGWYFIPVANLWKPYQAMKEIWKASARSDDWAAQPVPGILAWWWALWIIGNMTANLGGRLRWGAETLQQFTYSGVALLLSDIVWVALCVVFLLILNRVQQMQTSHRSVGPGEH